MADTSALLALADRVEREPPSWELECAIAKAVGFYHPHPDHTRPIVATPQYCTSLDAAVTLVPADAQETVIRIYPNGAHARITSGESWHVRVYSTHVHENWPAAALTAAALRAIAGGNGG